MTSITIISTIIKEVVLLPLVGLVNGSLVGKYTFYLGVSMIESEVNRDMSIESYKTIMEK